jgi:hypothetical protein
MLGRARDPKATSKSVAATRPSNAWSVWRQAGWGLAAIAALAVAVLSGRDDTAVQRLTAILSSLNVLPAQTPPHQFDAESASRQLAQAVHGLAEDRDRLATRLTALQRDIERDMEDVTGSIKKQVEAVKAAKSQPPPWPDDAPPVPMTPADVAAMVKAVSPAPAAPANPPSRTRLPPPRAPPRRTLPRHRPRHTAPILAPHRQ